MYAEFWSSLRDCQGRRYSGKKPNGMVMNRKVNKDEKVNGVKQNKKER